MKMLYTVAANEIWGLTGPKNPARGSGWKHRPFVESKTIPTGARKFLERVGLLEVAYRSGKGPTISHVSSLTRALKWSVQGEVTVVDWVFALQNIDDPELDEPLDKLAQRGGKDGDRLLRLLAYSSQGWRNGAGKIDEPVNVVRPSLLPTDRALAALWTLWRLGYIGLDNRMNEFQLQPQGWFYLGYRHNEMQKEFEGEDRKALAAAELLNGIQL
jgi:hypothetical protein